MVFIVLPLGAGHRDIRPLLRVVDADVVDGEHAAQVHAGEAQQLAMVLVRVLGQIDFHVHTRDGRGFRTSFRRSVLAQIAILLLILMCIENRPADRAGFEQGEAQQHRVPGALPDSNMNTAAGGDLPDQNGINRHADHDKKALQP